ncbi:MAG: hypothetical protein ACYCPR_04320 [Thermoplasmataceae archaeon]|jgi:hypothetical protein|nr:hypothetical protein [Candidatus Thermoplasmatota archaeon]
MKYAMREYVGKNVNISKLAEAIEDFFKEENFKTQIIHISKGSLIQARKGGIFRSLLAKDGAFTITIEGTPVAFKIRIGVTPWNNSLNESSIEPVFSKPMLEYEEVQESLWNYEIEHHLWHYVETQVELGIQ